MSVAIKKTVSVESGLYLDTLRKNISGLRRAIPKGDDPGLIVELIPNDYRVRITAKWTEWL